VPSGTRQDLAAVMTTDLPRTSNALKRLCDVGVATTLTVLSFPLTLLVLATMALDMVVCPADRGSFVYRERRVSRGREFDLLKLRTLRTAALQRMREPGDHARLLEGDPANLTWAARRLLKPWYLDELPQLVNILRGDICLVGPRPWPPAMVAGQVSRGVEYRLQVRAGWTGPAQVSKGRDVNYEELDLGYVERCRRSSALRLLGYDLGILRRTVGTMLRGEGLRY
jgi:lipopolysaccharide/colanic/teichoic acid biosynthesis glycosyltransferase